MATSNSYNFVVTRDNLITDALLHIGAIGEGETPSANAVTEASRVLNMICKLRAFNDGMPLWAIKRGVILPFTDSNSITTVSHVVQVGSYIETAIAADEASGQTTLTVDSITGISNGDQVGIELDDGTMHWTTINGVPSGSDIVITTALPSAAGDGNTVFTYTASSDRIYRPLQVFDANILEVSSDSRWEIDVVDHGDFYTNNSNLTIEGTPNTLYYDFGLGDATADPSSATTWYGTFYVWPRFTSGDYLIEFSYQRPLQDFDSSTDHPDFPQEFYLPLMLELAAMLGPRHQVPIEERKALFNEAKMYREEALLSMGAQTSAFLSPDEGF